MKINRHTLVYMMADAKMGIRDLAELSGLSRRTCSDILAGRNTSVRPATAGMIAAAFGVKTAEIVEE